VQRPHAALPVVAEEPVQHGRVVEPRGDEAPDVGLQAGGGSVGVRRGVVVGVGGRGGGVAAAGSGSSAWAAAYYGR
jgi:hypothetical protein